MKTFYLLRHGQYSNPNNIMPFRSNSVDLSDIGISQMQKNSQFLETKKIEALFSSPVLRCMHSAEIIAKRLNMKYEIDERLSEVNSPFFQDCDLDKYLAINKGNLVNLFTNKDNLKNGGETKEDIFIRVNSFFEEMLGRYDSIAAVSHGDPIMVYIEKKLHGKLNDEWNESYIPKGGIAELHFEEGELVKVNKINY